MSPLHSSAPPPAPGSPSPGARSGEPAAARHRDRPVYTLADFNALEEAADELLAREAEAVLADGGPTVTMAELLADLFSERGDGAA
ncbi:prevent-host-death protein [Streptomyces sp. NPDC047718]|uniref:prevent-host-death protein n=1 Tax=Streptomyces sp. NPDC047718 TaxID=3155479 RepID=UPI00340D42C0